MTLQEAIKLAHSDRDGSPHGPLKQPPPTPEEALTVLKESVRLCQWNWLTGRAAVRVLEEEICRYVLAGGDVVVTRRAQGVLRSLQPNF